MAPSRRKGGGRASAKAAAACRKWEVGDLVLAKVKGFPAWPATVSEPEKWGYSADWKKVLVYFFGTQQIAFCNPADVEEFTEEKKESLLVRLHGKGADFVRAVHEITESYDKLKKQIQVVEIKSVDGVTLTNEVNPAGDYGLKDQNEAPLAMLSSCAKKSYSTGDKNESILPVEVAADVTDADTLCDREASSEEPIDSMVATRKPLVNPFSSEGKHVVVHPQSSSSLRRGTSARRSRSSSRVDSSRFQKYILPFNNGNKAGGDVTSKALHDGLVRRSKRIRKSPEASEGHEVGSPALVSNSSIEEDCSEIVTVDSDTISQTDGSTVESGCKTLQPESIEECCVGDVDLSQTLDFPAKAIVKKKRKPNRKRVTSEAPETNGILSNEAGSEVEVCKTGQISPNSHEKLNERCSKEDGDEHLPLVKRARVRMGRSSSAGEELDTFIQSEGKLLEVSNSFSRQVSTTLHCEVVPADRNSFVVKGAAENPSLQNKCTQSSVHKPQLWEVKKKQQFGGSVDGEAALPPSKRLHRALEAMSANAAEDGQIEEPSGMDSLHTSMKTGAWDGFGVQNIDVLSNNATQDGTSSFYSSSGRAMPKEGIKSIVEVAICNRPVRSSSSPEHELCKDIHVDAVNHSDSKGISFSSSDTNSPKVVVTAQIPKPLSPNPGEEQARLECNQGSLARMLPLKDACRSEKPELKNPKDEKPLNYLEPSEHSGMGSVPASGAVDGKSSPQNDTNLLLCSMESNCSGNTKLTELPLCVNNQVDGMCEVVEEIKPTKRESNDILTPASAKVMKAAAEGQQPRLSRSSSRSDGHMGDKDLSSIRSSSSLTDGLESLARASPPNISICNTSTSDNDNILENNSSCSPDIVHHAKPKNMGRWSNKEEATAALASFQAVLGTLTRTKESIGRATRIAIDCAKFGISAKVVELLVRVLESETRLHRRVDLFFLVDSITQCSRGLKDVGDIYPYAIQAVLPRLLSAAAPPGSNAQENRRQCLKVLRLWLERRILPDSIVRHHIRDLESFSGSSSSGAFSRRPMRTERAFDDPIRQMEGMLVDEYGSNSSFQLPGFHMPPMLKVEDEGSDSDGGSFEAVTPEHNSETAEEGGRIPMPATIGNHRHILEDVDGELEMEDVAPPCEADMTSNSNVCINIGHTMHPQFPPPFAPPLPNDVPLSSPPPLPASPPPPPPPPPPPALPPMPPIRDPVSDGHDPKLYNIKENLHQFMDQQPVAPRISSDAVCYQAPESRDVNMQTQIQDSSSSCSFSNIPLPHPPIRPVNGSQQADGATFYNNAYHLRPPQPAHSNQFSYVQADQRSLREVPPPPFPNRDHFGQSTDGGDFYTDHDRMKLAPNEHRDSWRFSGPSFSAPGTSYRDPARGPYPPSPYTGPPCEPPLPSHGWGFPPRAMNHRELMPHRPPFEGPIPVAIRAPSFWRPR
ncbi:Protein HUA2-LIKE like [Actinidia chinensis var. chinensis]|uniref:Protein HUA2-LIKE like n=1 Tax=Actinidia chinensis var. chinensis TaxID=1590841 RepID=A0A2R6QE96_ACTCC|nr:Protein HUA2-LIKE like [Actinidia chinensis var. chinensis]